MWSLAFVGMFINPLAWQVSQFPFGEQEKQKGVAGTLRRLFDLDKDVPDTVQLASLKAMRRESVAMQAQLEENAEHRL